MAAATKAQTSRAPAASSASLSGFIEVVSALGGGIVAPREGGAMILVGALADFALAFAGITSGRDSAADLAAGITALMMGSDDAFLRWAGGDPSPPVNVTRTAVVRTLAAPFIVAGD